MTEQETLDAVYYEISKSPLCCKIISDDASGNNMGQGRPIRDGFVLQYSQDQLEMALSYNIHKVYMHPNPE